AGYLISTADGVGIPVFGLFEIPAVVSGLPDQAVLLNGMFKGFIDLTFEHDGRYYVADYKSNWLGPDDSAYTQDAMEQSILDHRY
ncbi:hypothetical protein, partial [Klebsiella pneumoniae]|uniref:hypothetical protein n=1 Tax=Klebsiella pneumoniae TaxID=573 RepID=UPI002731D0C0